MSVLVRGLLAALMFALLSFPPLLQRWMGRNAQAYVFTTILMTAVAIALAAGWPSRQDEPRRHRQTYAWTIGIGILAAYLLVVGAHSWVREILTIPIDPYRGDMLVVVREGLRRAAAGLNPYTIYHVPWAAPLPYGPMLWGPFAIPMAARIDLRFLTVAGELFAPVACAAAALVSGARGRLGPAAGALAMLAAIVLSGDLARFASVGHTPVYWPLVALFAWLVARERWIAAALSLGLLVVSRTTMVAIVPVLLMTVWMRDRRRFVLVCVLLTLAIALPLLPFAVWDPRALVYALYGSYETVIKAVVWPDPGFVHTIGVTGVLISNHLNRWVEAVQIAVMAVVYVACWLSLGRGRTPTGLMTLALLAFSMTTLWPVTYIYFDVCVLAAAGVLADVLWTARDASTWRVIGGWAAVLGAVILLVAVTTATMLKRRADEPPGVAWRDERHATVLLLRRTPSSAMIDIQLRRAAQGAQMGVALNGAPLGAVDAGGDHLMIAVPARAWQLGMNALDLSLESPIAISRVTVRPSR